MELAQTITEICLCTVMFTVILPFNEFYEQTEIRSVEDGICPIAEFTSPWLNCAAILAIRP